MAVDTSGLQAGMLMMVLGAVTSAATTFLKKKVFPAMDRWEPIWQQLAIGAAMVLVVWGGTALKFPILGDMQGVVGISTNSLLAALTSFGTHAVTKAVQAAGTPK